MSSLPFWTLATCLARISRLSVDDLERHMQDETAWRRMKLKVSLHAESQIDPPPFSDVEEARPGRLTPAELANVLSGGTPRESGRALARRLAERGYRGAELK
jgi:hypothetical protein